MSTDPYAPAEISAEYVMALRAENERLRADAKRTDEQAVQAIRAEARAVRELEAENERLQQQRSEATGDLKAMSAQRDTSAAEVERLRRALEVEQGQTQQLRIMNRELDRAAERLRQERDEAVNAAHRRIRAYQAGSDQLLADLRAIRRGLDQARLCDDCAPAVSAAFNDLGQLIDDAPTSLECGAVEPINGGVCVRPIGHAGETRPAPAGYDPAQWAQGHHYAYPLAAMDTYDASTPTQEDTDE